MCAFLVIYTSLGPPCEPSQTPCPHEHDTRSQRRSVQQESISPSSTTLHLVCGGCSRPDDIMVVFRNCSAEFPHKSHTHTLTLHEVSSAHVCVKCITASYTGSASRATVAPLMKLFTPSNPDWHIIFSEQVLQYLHTHRANPFNEPGHDILNDLKIRGSELLYHAHAALDEMQVKFGISFPLPALAGLPASLPVPYDPPPVRHSPLSGFLSEPCKLFFCANVCVYMCVCVHMCVCTARRRGTARRH